MRQGARRVVALQQDREVGGGADRSGSAARRGRRAEQPQGPPAGRLHQLREQRVDLAGPADGHPPRVGQLPGDPQLALPGVVEGAADVQVAPARRRVVLGQDLLDGRDLAPVVLLAGGADGGAGQPGQPELSGDVPERPAEGERGRRRDHRGLAEQPGAQGSADLQR